MDALLAAVRDGGVAVRVSGWLGRELVMAKVGFAGGAGWEVYTR